MSKTLFHEPDAILTHGTCSICGAPSGIVAQALGVCGACIRNHPDEALPMAMNAHCRSRRAFDLPVAPPRDPDGVPCGLCANACRIVPGGMGYCGLQRSPGGTTGHVSVARGKLSWYQDPLPTNCVGDWVCAGGTGAGFPEYAHCRGPEYGYSNLAVFFHACTFNCLYCQNWTYRERTKDAGMRSARELAAAVDERTACICYFGGDPTPQLPFSIRAAELARQKSGRRLLRLCWETNGSMDGRLLDKIMDLAVQSGGCVKFDLKAWDENLHKALTGVTNRQTLANFKRAAQKARQRTVPPSLIASTLMVPGYVDVHEIGCLARFIAAVDPDIPYSLLAFHPHFYLSDLPLGTRAEAQQCLQASRDAGLNNVRIGNRSLLRP